ncbi:glycosyltransferase family 4 protein [soil metagenome]
MKVLHVIDALGLGGGAEHSLAELLPRLRERGVESAVATFVPRTGGLQQHLIDEGFDVEVLHSRTWPGRVRELRRKFRREPPDLVHATLVNACLTSRVAGLGTGIPQINSVVNTTYDPAKAQLTSIAPWKLRVLGTVDAFTLRHGVDHVHAITDAVRDEVIDHLGRDPETVTVIPRGRSATALGGAGTARRDRVRADLGIAPDAVVVLNVGRQDPQKDQAGLVRAVAELATTHPHVELVIAGRAGSATADLDAAIASTGRSDNVRLLGHRDDVPDLLAAADIFAFPSLYEGLGCVLIEAMALETPIVGADAAAVAEVLEHGHLGEVVPRGDHRALADGIRRLVDDPGRRAELAALGRARFLDRYELDRIADATVDLYRSVLGAERPSES